MPISFCVRSYWLHLSVSHSQQKKFTWCFKQFPTTETELVNLKSSVGSTNFKTFSFFPWTFDPLKILKFFSWWTLSKWSQLGQFSWKALTTIYLSQNHKRSAKEKQFQLTPSSLVHRKAAGPRGMRRRKENQPKPGPPTGERADKPFQELKEGIVPWPRPPPQTCYFVLLSAQKHLMWCGKNLPARPLLKEACQMMVHGAYRW